ncbi:MAG: L-2-hydroxyglutarate oxidase [Chloroflexi bacterium]|nr:L-2-hydroxyglutarate oxidase [Chloroflexota bacterium]
MADTQYDIAIVGAGIIGLSTALTLLGRHPALKIAILEKGGDIAQQQTGHNSGVIHSGIYYRPGSFKARYCVEGRASMVKFCQENEIPYREIGKVIVAADEGQLERLRTLEERGKANQVEGLRLVDQDELAELEPHVKGIAALFSPKTGIVNYQDVTRVYAEKVQASGGELHLNSQVEGFERHDGVIYIETEKAEYRTKNVINCAGLHSDRVARMMGVDPGLRIIPFRGEYYTIKKEREYLVKHLIYPVPDPEFPFLGVHFTHNMKGYVEAGPNAVLAMRREGYRKRDFSIGDSWETFTFGGFWKMTARDWKTGFYEMNRSLRKSVFVKDLQKMIPEIQKSDLGVGGSGVRAQAVDNKGNLLDDFRIAQTEDAVHVLNAPSPGATASLVIGNHVANLAEETFSLV